MAQLFRINHLLSKLSPKWNAGVGSANGRNPLAIIVLQVIGHNGDLKGYAGGIERKMVIKARSSLLI